MQRISYYLTTRAPLTNFFSNPSGSVTVLQVAPAPVPKRKKSLPGAADAPATILSREEASVLSSQRREEVRRQAEEAERYRANPLLYFCSPQVKVGINMFPRFIIRSHSSPVPALNK